MTISSLKVLTKITIISIINTAITKASIITIIIIIVSSRVEVITSRNHLITSLIIATITGKISPITCTRTIMETNSSKIDKNAEDIIIKTLEDSITPIMTDIIREEDRSGRITTRVWITRTITTTHKEVPAATITIIRELIITIIQTTLVIISQMVNKCVKINKEAVFNNRICLNHKFLTTERKSTTILKTGKTNLSICNRNSN